MYYKILNHFSSVVFLNELKTQSEYLHLKCDLLSGAQNGFSLILIFSNNFSDLEMVIELF
jgi:hypothetical protein